MNMSMSCNVTLRRCALMTVGPPYFSKAFMHDMNVALFVSFCIDILFRLRVGLCCMRQAAINSFTLDSDPPTGPWRLLYSSNVTETNDSFRWQCTHLDLLELCTKQEAMLNP